jgi:multiple sugar transport system substrate-binding protein
VAFGGWFGAIDANSDAKQAAYSFLSFMANPENSFENVTSPETGANPFRETHFENMEKWREEIGLENPNEYLGAIQNTINHPNVQADLRIPEANQYFEALEAQLVQALAGSKSPEAALDAAAKEWNRITDEVGRESQLEAYRGSLGLE